MRAWFVIPPPATIYGARPLNETRLGPGLMLSLSWAQAIKSWFSGSGEMINNSDSAVMSVSRPRQVYLACSVCSAAVLQRAASRPEWAELRAAVCRPVSAVCTPGLMLQCCSHRPLPAPGLQAALQCLPWAGAMVCWREGEMGSEPSRWINGSTFALPNIYRCTDYV